MADDDVLTEPPKPPAPAEEPVPDIDNPDLPPQNEDQAEQHWLPKILEAAKKYDNPYDQDKFIATATRNARALTSIQLTANRQQRLAQTGEIDRVLGTPLKHTGTGPRTMEELRQADPHIDDKIEAARRLNPNIQRHVDQYLRHNISNDNVLTPDREQNYITLFGMMKNPQEINRFLDLDLTMENLTTKHRQELQKAQIGLGNKFQADPNVERALRSVRSFLNDVGIRESATDQAKQHQYNYFVGGLAQKLEEFQLQNKRQPQGYKEYRDLVAPLVRDAESNWIFSNRKYFEPPDAFKKEWSKKFEQKYGRPPGNQEMGQLYQRFLNRGTNAPE